MKVYVIKHNSCKEIKFPITPGMVKHEGAEINRKNLSIPMFSLASIAFPTELRLTLGGFALATIAIPIVEYYVERDTRKLEKMKKQVAHHKFMKEYKKMLEEQGKQNKAIVLVKNADTSFLFDTNTSNVRGEKTIVPLAKTKEPLQVLDYSVAL